MEKIERYRHYLSAMGLSQQLADDKFLRDYVGTYNTIINDTFRENLIQWVGHLLKSLDKMGEKSSQGFDLRLMYSESDVSSIPTSGTNLVIVANVKDVLYFRIFDADGKVVVDTDETRLTTQAGPIADLKRQLDSVRPPHELTRSEKDRVIAKVASIVGHTRSQQQNPEVDVELGIRCARRMRTKTVNLLKVPWGSADPSDTVDNNSDAMANLETRIQSVLRDCGLNSQVVDRKTYNEFFSEPKDLPTAYEQTPSICLFPFYKVDGNRPCWSMFKFGFQQKLGLIMNDATAGSLLHERKSPGYVEDVSLDWLLDRLHEGLRSSQANKGKYQRNVLLDFGKGYAATDILEVMLKRGSPNPVDFRKEELLVSLAEAIEDPIRPSEKPVTPIERKEDVAKLLRARWGTRLALISDPGEPTFIYLKNNYDPDLVIYDFRHNVSVEVGIGFSLGMIRWFVALPKAIRGLADQIYNFLIGEPKSEGWRHAIESRGIDIVEGYLRNNYYHDPSVLVDPNATGGILAN